MKTQLYVADRDLDPGVLAEVVQLLLKELGFSVYETDETNQGRKHGITEIILEKDTYEIN